MLELYFIWLKKALPLFVWEALEQELNCFEESLPHLRETQIPWMARLIVAWWATTLLIKAVHLYITQFLLLKLALLIATASDSEAIHKTSILERLMFYIAKKVFSVVMPSIIKFVVETLVS